jgi:hypothetical protein
MERKNLPTIEKKYSPTLLEKFCRNGPCSTLQYKHHGATTGYDMHSHGTTLSTMIPPTLLHRPWSGPPLHIARHAINNHLRWRCTQLVSATHHNVRTVCTHYIDPNRLVVDASG